MNADHTIKRWREAATYKDQGAAEIEAPEPVEEAA
jgi:hypothetical protein